MMEDNSGVIYKTYPQTRRQGYLKKDAVMALMILI